MKISGKNLEFGEIWAPCALFQALADFAENGPRLAVVPKGQQAGTLSNKPHTLTCLTNTSKQTRDYGS